LYQRGQGVGGFLASLFKSCLPLLKKRGVAIGKTLLSAGTDMFDDLQNDMSLRSSFQNRKQETFDKLKRNVISGEGYKNGQKRKRSQSLSGSQANHSRKKPKTVAKPRSAAQKQKPIQRKNLKKQIRDYLS
jgi:hypothetical protein